MNASPEEIARRLGTSRRRVVSAARRLAVGRFQHGQWVFTPDDERVLRDELGVDPAGPLPRSQMRVLAELALRPCGLASARAVAVACALAPATASSAVKELVAKDLVLVRDGLLHANVMHPRWVELRPSLRGVCAPVRVDPDRARVDPAPARVDPAPARVDPAPVRVPRPRGPVD